MTSASDDADRPSFNGHPGQPVPSYPSPQAIPPQTRRLSSTVTNRTTHSPTQELSRIRSSHQTASSLSEDPERPRQPQPPSPAPPEANAPPPAEEVTPLRLGAHYSGLVLASMLGTLIRLGLGALATYDGMVIYSLAWAQGVGCGIMGLALARKTEIVNIYPPLYTFMTTGLAGSVTTFSSWMLESYQAFSNFNHYNRKGLHDTVDGLAYSFSTFAISIACLHLGSHISSLPIPLRTAPRAGVPNTNGAKESSSSTTHYPKKTPLLDILTIISAFLSYLIAILLYFLAPSIWRHRATFPLLLAPPGAILRFFLARLNTRHIFIDRFPLGTFLANMIATLVISGVFAAQRQPGVTSRFVTCNALYAIQEGFCGCLSTVSTLAIESRAIKGVWWKWIYVGGSVVLGHILVLVIVGGTRWGEGYSSVCQGSFG